MEIQTQILDHVIVFIDKTHKFISKQEYDSVIRLSTTDTKGMVIQGNYYNFGSIKCVITKDEFYEKYPEKIPVQVKEFENVMIKKVKSKSDMQGILKGLNQCLAKKKENNEPHDNVQELINKAKKNLRKYDEKL